MQKLFHNDQEESDSTKPALEEQDEERTVEPERDTLSNPELPPEPEQLPVRQQVPQSSARGRYSLRDRIVAPNRLG